MQNASTSKLTELHYNENPFNAPAEYIAGWYEKMTGRGVRETLLGCLIENDVLRGLFQSAMIELKADNYE